MAKASNGKEKQEGMGSDLVAIKKALDIAEAQIKVAKSLLFGSVYKQNAARLGRKDGKTVPGVFDGQAMIGADGNKYVMASNYASKSKLVPGDELKLTIKDDGLYEYKQINPVERKRVVGRLNEDDGRYFVNVGKQKYEVLVASVSFLKAQIGDKIALIIPKGVEAQWGAIDNIVSKIK